MTGPKVESPVKLFRRPLQHEEAPAEVRCAAPTLPAQRLADSFGVWDLRNLRILGRQTGPNPPARVRDSDFHVGDSRSPVPVLLGCDPARIMISVMKDVDAHLSDRAADRSPHAVGPTSVPPQEYVQPIINSLENRRDVLSSSETGEG